jgi:hypothetical protein
MYIIYFELTKELDFNLGRNKNLPLRVLVHPRFIVVWAVKFLPKAAFQLFSSSRCGRLFPENINYV